MSYNNQKDATVYADRVREFLNSNPEIEVVTVDEVGKEVAAYYKIQDAYQSSFTVKAEYGGQFTEEGAYVVNNTIMLPAYPESIEGQVAVENVEEAISEFTLGGLARVNSGGVPQSDDEAVRISFDKVQLEEFLTFLGNLTDVVDEQLYQS